MVAKSFVEEGVQYVFSICGGHIYPIYKALDEEGLQIISTRTGIVKCSRWVGQNNQNPWGMSSDCRARNTNILPVLISVYYLKNPVFALAGHRALRYIDKHAN